MIAPPLAHAGHWLVQLAYLAPLVVLVAILVRSRLRERRERLRGAGEASRGGGDEAPGRGADEASRRVSDEARGMG